MTRLEQIGAKAAQQAFAHVPIIRPEQLAAMAEISGGSPHGAATIAAGDGSRLPSENEPAMARSRAGTSRGPLRDNAAMSARPFHLAFPVHDLAEARRFYGGLLGCPEGRSSPEWVDFDLYGHQVVAHLAPGECAAAARNEVDGDAVPVRHFGVVLPMDEWQALAARLRAADVRFTIEPHVRFEGQPGEQATMFFLDPSGNALEFKAFADPSRLFAK